MMALCKTITILQYTEMSEINYASISGAIEVRIGETWLVLRGFRRGSSKNPTMEGGNGWRRFIAAAMSNSRKAGPNVTSGAYGHFVVKNAMSVGMRIG